MNVTVNVVEWEKREEAKQEACDFAPFSSLPIRGYLLSGPGLPSAVRWGLLGAVQGWVQVLRVTVYR